MAALLRSGRAAGLAELPLAKVLQRGKGEEGLALWVGGSAFGGFRLELRIEGLKA